MSNFSMAFDKDGNLYIHYFSKADEYNLESFRKHRNRLKSGDNKIPPTNKSTGLADQNPIEELGDKIAELSSDKAKELGEYLGIENELSDKSI